jgi:hypothetical protein
MEYEIRYYSDAVIEGILDLALIRMKEVKHEDT